MAILLGVDTGGTYTDAVLMQDEDTVIASAKALTTRHDLAVGIGAAVAAVLAESGVDPREIALASLSTTLATNALVEGQGGRVGLVYIGFREGDLASHGLSEALGGDPALVLAGGHDHAGGEARPLDHAALAAWLDGLEGVSAYAVAAQFATRNPAHEVEAARMIQAATGRPVSCSHHLSARLNGPKRALTAVLNARLIGMIDRLIGSARASLGALGIEAPLMVVRGDGALISSAMARERPIETILSGPAASIVGARWLSGERDALVADIGGTTTDVAVLRDGRPQIDPQGAQVGPYRTMVEAVAMRTFGLGGDSEVHVVDEGLDGGVTLGPRRLLPIALAAHEEPEAVLPVLEEQLREPVPGEYAGRFLRRLPGLPAEGLAPRDAQLLARITDSLQPLGAVLRTRLEAQSLRRLSARGLVQIAGVTPSDASHLRGTLSAWNEQAARMALDLMARRRTGTGDRLAADGAALAEMIVAQLTRQTVLALLECAFAEEDVAFGAQPALLARHVLMQRGLAGHRGLVRLDAGLNLPLVGLGASARSYYPAVGQALHCAVDLPAHGGVANAIGAVVGRITMRRSGSVTSPAEGRFRVHLDTGPLDFGDAESAMAALEAQLTDEAVRDARRAGAEDIATEVARDQRGGEIESRQVFVEAAITVTASGRPRIAESGSLPRDDR